MKKQHRVEFVNDSIELNFEINTDDLPPILENKVYLDFMEAVCFADVFVFQVDY